MYTDCDGALDCEWAGDSMHDELQRLNCIVKAGIAALRRGQTGSALQVLERAEVDTFKPWQDPWAREDED
jgi:hypothetical protein